MKWGFISKPCLLMRCYCNKIVLHRKCRGHPADMGTIGTGKNDFYFQNIWAVIPQKRRLCPARRLYRLSAAGIPALTAGDADAWRWSETISR